MRIAGLVVLIATTLAGIGSNLSQFADLASFILVLGFVVGVLLLGRVRVGPMFRALSGSPDPDEVAEAVRGWKLARRSALAGGLLFTLVGGLILLRFITPETPTVDILGGSAIGLLTLIYGLFLGYGLCLPCESAARRGQVGERALD